MTEEKIIFGMTPEKFKETILTSLVMSAFGFGMAFISIAVRNYFERKTELRNQEFL